MKIGIFQPAASHGLIAILAGIGVGFTPKMAAAQSDQAPQIQQADIIVTAGKREELITNLPLSVTAIQGDQLDRLAASSIADIAALVPGFTVARSFRGPPIYTLRGVGFNSPNLSAASPVGIYMDEISYPYPVMAEGLAFDLARVEILKGPQGTLFGRNTTGGLVNSIANRPRQEAQAYGQFSVGSYQSYGLQGALGGGLTRTLSARLAFDVQRSDKGWQQSVSHGSRLGEVDKAAARLSLLWQPAQSAEFLLTANWWQDKSETQAAQAIEYYPYTFIARGLTPDQWPAVVAALGLPAATLTQSFSPTHAGQANWTISQLPWGGSIGGNNFTPAPLEFRKNNAMRSLSLRADIDVAANVELTSLSAYAKISRDEASDAGGWDLENGILRGQGFIETFSQELRLSGDTGNLTWLAGLAFASDHVVDQDKTWSGTSTVLQPLRVAGAGYAASAGADLAAQQDVLFGFRDYENRTQQHIRSYAGFGQAQWHLAPTINATMGLRYTRDSARFSGCSRDLGDNSIAATWNAFFNGSGIPAAVAPGGCVTYLADLEPAILSGGTIAFPGQGLVSRRLEEDNLSGRLAIDWHMRPDTLVYVSATRGFKAGAFPNIEANVAVQYEPAVQEELRAFEFGLKTRPSSSLSLNAATFYSDYRNKQVFGAVEDIIFGQLNRIVNMPRSHIYGAEIEASLVITPTLVVDARASYTRTRIDEYVGLDEFGIRQDFTGEQFSYTPRLQAFGSVSQGFMLGGGIEGSAMVSARYASRQQSDLDGDPRFAVKSHAVVDANLTFTTRGQSNSLTIFVKNIADSYYWNSVHSQSDSIVRYAAMPRTWGISLRREF